MPAPRILVPLDGSPTGEVILPFLRMVAPRLACEILLVRAVHPAQSDIALYTLQGLKESAEAYLEKVEQGLKDEGARVETFVRTGDPVKVVSEIAVEEYATMIAMATHGRTGLKRALLGSVAEHVLRESPLPVLVVRAAAATDPVPPPLRTILVPVESAELLHDMRQWVEWMASLWGARILLLHAIDPSKDRKADEELARKLEEKFPAASATAILAAEDDPVEAILKTASLHGADLIAMPTHARTGVRRMRLGSVTEAVLRRSTVPVFILRAPQGGAAGAEEIDRPRKRTG